MRPLHKLEYKLCPTKINLGLKVLHKRLDNFHEIQSIFLKVLWGDEIFFQVSDLENHFEIISENLIFGKTNVLYDEICNPNNINNNLLYKIFQNFISESKTNLGLKVYLKKNVPLGSGLGGASSCAASLLLYLKKTFNYFFTKNLSINFGCDIAFFLQKEHAYITGIGEEIQPLKICNGIGLLAFPDIFLETKYMYETLKKPLQKETNFNQCTFLDESILEDLKQGHWSFLKDKLSNDFEIVAFSKFSILQEIKEYFYRMGASYSSMSGSGSSIFCLVQGDEIDKLSFIKKQMEEKFPRLSIVSFKF